MRSFGAFLLLLALATSAAGKPGGPSLRSFIQHYDARPSATPLPAGADRYRYVFVKGLLGNSYPFYMSRAKNALTRRGAKVEFAPIKTGQGTAYNSAIIEKMIRETDRPIVFVGHSKGVSDASDAFGRLAKADPALLSRNVRGFVAIEGAYGGSPVADTLARHGWGRLTMWGLSKLFLGSTRSGYDLTTATRRALVADHPMPASLVPTISFIGTKKGFFSSQLGPLVYLIKRRLGLASDGLVAARDAAIPGAVNVGYSLDHRQGAFGKYSERITVGLVTRLLSAPDLQPAR